MENFETKLSLERLQDSDNINELLSDEDSSKIGKDVLAWYEADKSSRTRWEDKMEEATKLALQVKETKTYPWPKASNVKFPLITIAATQFAARSYPALVKAPDLVKFRVQGKDDGTKASRASRISQHMSYQLLEEDESWEEHMDRALLALPILGCIFKKSYYDVTKGHNCSHLVLPKDLVVHYYAKNIEDAERKTEVYKVSERAIKEKQLRKVFSEFTSVAESTQEDAKPPPPSGGFDEPEEADERQGTMPPFGDQSQPYTLLESHCYLDLDGDGYKEPYVVTIEKNSGDVLRVVSRWKKVTTEQSVKIEELQKRIKAFAEGLPQPQEGQPVNPQMLAMMQRAEQTIMAMQAEVKRLAQEAPKVLKIDPIEYYTKYSFIPAPDGGFYDLGFGALLGPLNDSVNTLLNQMIDSGHLYNGQQGFIGKGARIKGGKVRFSPNQYIKVNATGSALRDNIVPLPANAPSPVLFNLLSLLISYSERVGSVTDTMVGENPGQNTPAYNMSAMLEQGLQVFNGIFKRVYRSMRGEFRKLYSLNAVYLDDQQYFEYHDADANVMRTDYTGDPKDLIPAADPNAFSNKEKMEKASMIKQNAQVTPGYNPIEVELRWLDAMDIPDARQLFPLKQNPETGQQEYVFPPQPNPELEIEKADMQRRTAEGKARAEADLARAEGDLMLKEAQVAKIMAELDDGADKNEIERLKIIQKDLEARRKAMVEIIKAKLGEKKDEGAAQKAD